MQQLARKGHKMLLPSPPVLPVVLCLLFFSTVQGDWNEAMEGTFALQSGALGISNQSYCSSAIAALLQRQGIPTTALALRSLDDTELLQLAMLAAVGGVSRWARTKAHQQLGAKAVRLLLDDRGGLVHTLSPGAMQNDVMLCVISALLAVLLLFHVLPA
jgi:hypothetical protein